MLNSVFLNLFLHLYFIRPLTQNNEDADISGIHRNDRLYNALGGSVTDINRSFDITYINLEKNKERNTHMTEMLDLVNCNYTRFNGVSGIDVFYNRSKKLEDYYPEGFNGPVGFDVDKMNYHISDSGTLGCKMSHYLLIKALSLKENAKPLLILEDDLDINFDFVSKVEDTLRHMPKEWDILLLTAFYDTKSESPHVLKPGISHVDFFFECLAYIVNGDKAAKRLIAEVETSDHLKPIDIIFGDMSRNNKIFTLALDPHIAIQRRDIFGSDIANSESLIPLDITNSLMNAKEVYKNMRRRNKLNK